MKKYLVIIKVGKRGYSLNNQLCGIFNTEDEAIDWVLNHPTIKVADIYGKPFEFTIKMETFDHNLRKLVKVPQSELREYIRESYIVEFNGSPVCVGFYEK